MQAGLAGAVVVLFGGLCVLLLAWYCIHRRPDHRLLAFMFYNALAISFFHPDVRPDACRALAVLRRHPAVALSARAAIDRATQQCDPHRGGRRSKGSLNTVFSGFQPSSQRRGTFESCFLLLITPIKSAIFRNAPGYSGFS